MFYIASKILGLLLSPFLWICGVFSYAASVSGKSRKRAMIVAFALLFVFSNEWIFQRTMLAWEPQPVLADSLVHFHRAIVAGGMASYDHKSRQVHFAPSGERLFQAVELYRRNRVDKIFITSGSGGVWSQSPREADFLKAWLIRQGIPEGDIEIENRSKNTRQNALYTREFLDTCRVKGPNLLITSASHMPRAVRCFRKAGVAFVPFPVDYYGSSGCSFTSLYVPNASTLARWEYIIHEWAGCIVYWAFDYM